MRIIGGKLDKMFGIERERSARKFFVPETMQVSNMDCGPAVLKSIAAGFGKEVNYNRLREACETDVDGSSIDALQALAVQLQLDAEQMIIPIDHLLLAEADVLPAIIVTQLPQGEAHFVVVWNKFGRFVQIMDPAHGRRWVDKEKLFEDIYEYQHRVPAAVWREWAGSEGFLDPLKERLFSLNLAKEQIDELLINALKDLSWRRLALLDSVVRMVKGMSEAAHLSGLDAYALLQRFLSQKDEQIELLIPENYWSVVPIEPIDGEPYVLFRGAIVIRFTGINEVVDEQLVEQFDERYILNPEKIAQLIVPNSPPEKAIWELLKEDGFLAPSALFFIICLSVLGLMIEALLFRGLLEAGKQLVDVQQRTELYIAILVFFLLMMLFEIPLNFIMLKLGQRLETRLRIRFLEKLPKLGEQYFRTRLNSDLVQRMHEMRLLRMLPQTAVSFVRIMVQILLTVFVITLLHPTRIFSTLLAAASAIVFAFAFQPFLIEHDLRFRTHTSSLTHFYLDALLGAMPIRTHNAQQVMRREHESLLSYWTEAGLKFYNLDTQLHLLQSVLGVGFAIWIVTSYIIDRGEGAAVLLLFYWTLNLPVLGQSLAKYAEQYPTLRNRIVRLLEPLEMVEEIESYDTALKKKRLIDGENGPTSNHEGGMEIELKDVSLELAGVSILKKLDVLIHPGEHIGIVGRSGAGKSMFMQLLLGLIPPTEGEILIDGVQLLGERLVALRRDIAWVDSDVQLWNKTLLHNLQYGSYELGPHQVGALLEDANLMSILEQLPHGLQTELGDGGRLISAGEGQRVRIGRALGRMKSRLFILDEPFRGVEEKVRKNLLNSIITAASKATVLLITHKVKDTLSLPRVLVIDKGAIVEDGVPTELIKNHNSHYYRLIESERNTNFKIRRGWKWEQWFLKNQELHVELPIDEQ